MLWCLGGAWWCLVVPGGAWWCLVVLATKACGNGRVPDEPWQMMLAGRCVAGDV